MHENFHRKPIVSTVIGFLKEAVFPRRLPPGSRLALRFGGDNGKMIQNMA
ncbi:MAG: hypothetical protein ACOX8W_12475 [bacterium]|jgi:hypothetical protein